MSSSPVSPDRVVLRGVSGYWYAGLTALVMVILLGDAAIRGAWDVVATALPWMLLLGWAMYLVLIRPAVIVERDLLRVRNILRDHDIAWESISGYTNRFQLTVLLHGGLKIGAWGGPKVTVGRPKRGAQDREPEPLADEVIRDARASLGPLRSAPASSTASTWDVFGIAVTITLVVACIATVIL